MQIELYDQISQPKILSAKRVVVKNDHGTPMCVALELRPGIWQCATHNDANFEAILDALGISKTEVRQMKAPQLADFGL
jgi:hypothetical protein